MNRSRLQRMTGILAVACMLAILYLTLTPSKGTPIETISDFTVGGDVGDAVLHCMIFILHTLLWSVALYGWRRQAVALRYVLILGLLLGLGTETAQIFLPTRGAILMDYSANVLGVLFGLTIAQVVLPRVYQYAIVDEA